MEAGTSDFDRWLKTVNTNADDLALVPALDLVAESVDKAYGASIWFAEILGRRWSYIAGRPGDAPFTEEIRRVSLDDRIGLIANGWGSLSEIQRGDFIASLRELVSAKHLP